MALHLTGSDNPMETSLSSLIANLPELLGAMIREGDRVLAVVDFPDYRYVQFWAEGGLLISEVISNQNLEIEAITADQEDQLVTAGWNAPDEFSPNFYFTITSIAQVPFLMKMVTHVILHILEQGSTLAPQTASIKTFSNAGEGVADILEARGASRVRIVENWVDNGGDVSLFSDDDGCEK
ncbi:unannotated protein [freshwater metagenome]|uniref:Unannotated protein n=1 Tax=freshwater metagenome TaxID=449393 RepID=A0A6J7CU86_9ZZZZ|nr:hypothetical protein [Actinomycetota bacterium]MUH57779.1 hypothetical protein [Actinomycetota bacterium]